MESQHSLGRHAFKWALCWQVNTLSAINAYNVLHAENIVIEAPALKYIQEFYGPPQEDSPDALAAADPIAPAAETTEASAEPAGTAEASAEPASIAEASAEPARDTEAPTDAPTA